MPPAHFRYYQIKVLYSDLHNGVVSNKHSESKLCKSSLSGT